MGLIMEPVLALLRRVPLWAWALCLCLAWGGFQRHQARSAAAVLAQQQAQAAKDREAALQASIAETERRLKAQEEITHAADQAASQARADAAAADDALRGLRARLAALKASPRPGNSAASSPGPAGRLADVLDQCATRYSAVAAAADRAIVAGQACERSYQSLKP